MLKTQWYERRRRTRRQRGAALVEGALVFPLLMFLVFGIIESGHLLGAYSSMANGARAGGRMASVQGRDASADQMTLARISDETEAIRDGEIQFIIIWEADGPDLDSSANQSRLNSCITVAEGLTSPNPSSQGVDGICNVYARPDADGGAFDMALGNIDPDPMTYFGCLGVGSPGSGSKVDCNWAPRDRETRISPRVLPSGGTRIVPDYVGVYIRIDYQFLTGILGANREINESSVTLLEPETFGVGT